MSPYMLKWKIRPVYLYVCTLRVMGEMHLTCQESRDHVKVFYTKTTILGIFSLA